MYYQNWYQSTKMYQNWMIHILVDGDLVQVIMHFDQIPPQLNFDPSTPQQNRNDADDDNDLMLMIWCSWWQWSGVDDDNVDDRDLMLMMTMMMTMIWCWWWQWHERKDDSMRFSAAGSFFVRTHAQSAERRCLSDFSNGCVTHCAELHYTLYNTHHRRRLRKSRLPRNSCKAWLCIFIYIIMWCRLYTFTELYWHWLRW